MSTAEPIVCTNCGATLEPRVLESKVKCTYCDTVFAVVRDHGGVRGVAADGTPGSAPGGAPAGPSAAGPSPAAPSSGLDPQTIQRLERDAFMVVRGLEAAEETAYAARGLARVGSCGCLGVVLLALSLAGLVLVLAV